MIDLNMYFLGSAVLLSALLLISFIKLFVKYNKDKILPIDSLSEKELIDKYGTVISACILEKRDVCSRDVLSTIVELIQKDIISINSKRVSENGVIINSYLLKYEKKNEKLDQSQKDILDVLFDKGDTCVLNDKLKNPKNVFTKFKTNLNSRLNKLGVNGVKVPKKNQILNNIFFVFVCIFFTLHLVYNFKVSYSFNEILNNMLNWIVIVIKIDALVILLVLLTKIISLVAERINSKNNYEKIVIADKIFVSIFLKFLISNLISFIFLIFAGNNLFFIADIILFDIAMVTMLSDELLVSHSPRINKDYISLKKVEEKIKSKALIEFIDSSKVEELKISIPLIISLNVQDDIQIDYLQKLVDISLDEKEIRKYQLILAIMRFNESSIEKFYIQKEI